MTGNWPSLQIAERVMSGQDHMRALTLKALKLNDSLPERPNFERRSVALVALA